MILVMSMIARVAESTGAIEEAVVILRCTAVVAFDAGAGNGKQEHTPTYTTYLALSPMPYLDTKHVVGSHISKIYSGTIQSEVIVRWSRSRIAITWRMRDESEPLR